MPEPSPFKVYSAYTVWTVLNLVLIGLSAGLFFHSWPQNITINKHNLLNYYPHFWSAITGKYNAYTDVTKFKDGKKRLTLKALADPGKCTKANADYCYGNEENVQTKMWYTYRFSQYYTIDNAAVLDGQNNSIIPMLIHNDDKNASVSKHAWEDGIEGNRLYSPAECYETIRSYYHIFQAQAVIMFLFLGYHAFLFFGFGIGAGDLEKVIPFVFDVSVVIYGIGLLHSWYLMVEVNENRKHCAHLSGWFGNSAHSMHTYVSLNLGFYVVAMLAACVTAYVFKIYNFEKRQGSRSPGVNSIELGQGDKS